MRYVFSFGLALALGLALMAGCSDENGEGGSAGTAGIGGMAGTGGMAGVGGEGGTGGTAECPGLYVDDSCAVLSCEGFEDGTLCLVSYYTGEIGICIDGGCQGPECEVDTECNNYNDCTVDSCLDIRGIGICERAAVQDGTPCAGGTCEGGECALQSTVLPCTEQGIRNAIAAGGGPYTFDCDGPTTVVTEAEIVIDNDVILDGEGKLTVDGNNEHGVFRVDADVTVELHGLTVTRGLASYDPAGGIIVESGGDLTLTDSTVSESEGGIHNGGQLMLVQSTVSGNRGRGGISNSGRLTLTDSVVADNTGEYGGGIHSGGTAALIRSIVTGNTTDGYGGGIYNSGTLALTASTVSANTALSSYGSGGIDSTGTVTLTKTTVSGNAAMGPRGTGGIHKRSGTLTLTNSTVSGNTAKAVGGIHNEHGTLAVWQSTVSGNAAYVSGIYNSPYGSVTLTSTLIDNECAGAAQMSGGANLESPGDTCGFDEPTDLVEVTAEQLKLGPLQDNGGPTMTHGLLVGSAALDAVPEAQCVDAGGEPLTEDQRGVMRPQGPDCDVGAFELEVTP